MRQLRFVGVSKQFGYAEHVFSSYVLPNQIHYLGYEIVGADPRWVCADDDHPTRAKIVRQGRDRGGYDDLPWTWIR